MKHDGILQKTLMAAVTALMLCALAGLALASTTASGTWGTCAWTLDSNGTLTVGTGTGVDNSGSSPWSRYSSQTKKIVFESGVVLPANCYNLFSSMNKLESVDFSGVDASRVTSIRGMFNYCSALKSLDLTPFASATLTGSQTSAFSSCSALQSLDVSMLNTRGATDLSYMFYNCRSLKQLTLGGFSTASATTLNRMFYSCAALESLDLSGFDTRNVVQGDASYSNGFMEIFRGCDALHEVSLGANTVIASSGQIAALGLPDGMWRSAADGQLYSASVAGGTRLGIADTYTYEGAGNVWGTCAWELDEEGTLTVHAGVGGGASGDQLTPFRSVRSNVKRVVFDEGVVLPESCAYLFQGLMNMCSVDFTGVDASRVKYIASMFDQCLALKSVDLAPFAQASLTGGQSNVFNGCSALTTLDVSMLNTQNVTNMRAMFMGCSSLEQITFGGFSTASVTDVTNMFAGCEKLETLDLSGFDTRQVTNWGSSGYTATFFTGCNALRQISFGANTVLTGSVTSLGIPAGNWRAASDGQIYTAAEAGGTRLGVAETYTYAGASGTWGTCPWELDIDGTLTVHPGTGANNYSSSSNPWYTYRNTIREIVFESGVILPENCNSLFYYFNKLERVDFSGVDASAVTSISNLFYNCSALTEVDMTPFASAALSGYHPSVFEGCKSLETLDVSMLNTRAVTDMSNLFRSCGRLREISFGDMSTASVIAMAEMFASCSSLEVLDLSGFDTRKVTMWNYGEDSGCSNMFDGCKSLGEITLGENVIIPANASNNVTHLGLPGNVWRAASDGVVYTAAAAGGSRLGTQETYTRVDADASGVWGTCAWTLKDGTLTVHPGAGANNYSSSSPWYTYRNTIREIVFENGVVLPAECGGLFYNLDKLERVDFSGVDASAVTSIRDLFYNCSALTDVDMAPFASAALSGNQYSVFAGCSSLEALDVSMLNTRAVTGFSSMFWDCRSLRELQLGALTTAEATDLSTMFSFCESLETLDLSGFDTRKVTMWNAGEAGGASNMFEGCSALRVITLGEHVVIPANADNDVTRLGLPEGNWQAASDGQIYTAAEAGGTRLGTAETYTYTGATGAWGTCEWEFDPLGTLTVHAGLGEGLKPWYAIRHRVRRIVFEDGVALPANCSYLFMFMSAESIDFGNVDTSRLTTMTSMFEQAPNLRTLDLSRFDTRGVTNMTSAFGLYSIDRVILGENFTFKGNTDAALTTLPNYTWRSQATGEVYTAAQIANERDGIADTYTRVIEGDWGECHWTLNDGELRIGAGTGADTDGTSPWSDYSDRVNRVVFESGARLPEDASRLFSGFARLEHVDMAGLDVSGAKHLDRFFFRCKSLFELDLTGWNTAGLTSAQGMFEGCTKLAVVHVGQGISFTGETDGTLFDFGDTRIYLHGDWWSVADGCRYTAAQIAETRGGIADTYSKMAPWTTTDGLWGSCVWKMTVENEIFVYAGTGVDAVNQTSPWKDYGGVVTAMYFEDGVVLPENCGRLFKDLNELKVVTFGEIDASHVTSIEGLFYGCYRLEAVDMSAFADAHLTGYHWGVFYDCYALRTLDVSMLNFDSVGYTADMFWGCHNLESLKLGDITYTGNSSGMANMFGDCRKLKTLDLSGFDTATVTSMERLFYGCSALETLDLSSFDTHNVTNMNNLFQGCASLREVRLGERFSFKGQGDTPMSSLPVGKWLSEADQRTYYANQIAEDRADIADTYTFEGDDGSAAGHWGTCEWVLNTEGEMTVSAGTGVDTVNRISPWTAYSSAIMSIYFEDDVVLPENCSGLFNDLNELRTVTFGEIDASHVTSIEGLFYGCYRLEAVDMSAFADAHLTGYHWGVFYDCYALRTLDVSMLNFDSVGYTADMFWGCHNLESLKLCDITYTGNSTGMANMFGECRKLKTLDLSGFDTATVTSMERLFYGCSALETLDLSSFDTHNVGDMNDMFQGCASLREVRLGERFSFKGQGDMPLNSLPVGKWLSEAEQRTYYANQIAEDRADIADTYTYEGDDGSAAGHWGTCEWVLNTEGEMTVSAGTGVDTVNRISPWTAYSSAIMSIYFEDGVVLPENCSGLFKELYQLRTVTFGEIDASHVTSIEAMFYECNNLEAVDMSAFAEAHLAGTHWGVFYDCYAIQSLDVSMLNFDNVGYTANMFWGCHNLESLKLSDITYTGNSAGIANMFGDCRKLKALDLSGFDTSTVTDMERLFYGCSALETLDLSSFDTHNVTNMNNLFQGCASLRQIRLGEGFTFKGNSEDSIMVNLPTGTWYSRAADDYFTSDQISSYRDGIADVYSRDAEGDWGECHWTLAGRNLTVGAGVGANTAGICPWAGFTDEIAEIAFDAGVVFPADASRLFADMSGLNHIDMTDVDTSTTTNMSGMFAGLAGLNELDVTGFDTTGVTDMSHMFEGLTGLTELNVTGFNTSGVTDMSCMFDGMSGVRILDLTGFDTGAVSAADGMFDGMTSLEEVHVGALLTFGGGMALPEYEINGHADWFSEESVRWLEAAEIASGRGGIADTYCKQARGTWGTAPWTLDEDGLLTVSAGEGAATGNSSPWASLSADITAVSFEDGVVFPTDSRALLRDFTALEQVSFGSVDTASVTDLSYTFAGCASLRAVNLAGLDLNSVTNMAATFMGDAALEVIDLTGSSMSALKMMINTFQRCESLKTLDLSGINAMGLTRLNAAFSGCAALETLDLSGLGTGSATSMSGAFLNCDSLRVVTLGEAFSFTGAGSTALTTLPAGSWLSAADGEAYTEAEIAAQRSGIADTYTRVVSLEGAELTWGDEPLIYNGEPQKPQLQVTLDGVTLAEDEDYTVEYPEDITSAGHVTVTIRGINAYSGTLTGEYVIAPAAIDDATLTLENDSLLYTGEALEPEVLVLLGSDVLEPSDYTVAYADNVNAGTAKVIVTGVGNYTGEVTETFTITPISIEAATVVVEEGETIYSGEAHTPAVKVMLGEAELDATAYTVTYADNVNAGTATITVAGIGNYTGQIGAVFTIQPASIGIATVKVAEGEYIYSGEPHTPAVKVTLGEIELAVGDYTVAYADNVNAGTAEITVTGTGNYTGETAAQFEIAARDMSDADVLLSQDSFTYSGGEMKPDVTVMLDADVLEEGLDYATTYQDNVNAGTAKVIVTGTGNYTGSVETPFTIAKVDISGATLLILDSPSYTGEPQEPEVLVALGSDDLDDSNYTVAYADNVNAGTARVTVTGVGNYTGTLEELFEILPRSISGMTLQVIPSIVATDGEAVEPRVILIDGEMTIAELDVTYADNMAAGTGRVTVRASGNYTGSKSGTFTILNRSELTTLTLPAAIRTIEAEGFAGTAAQRVVIPAQCENIESLAFEDCRSLVEIDILSDTVSIAEDALDGNTDVTIRAHAGSAAAAFADANGIRWIPVD